LRYARVAELACLAGLGRGEIPSAGQQSAGACKQLLAFPPRERYRTAMESSRMKILDAAQRVYAEHGFRGATTRRIAELAGVNEVTLFRIFRSKDALLEEAVRPNATRREVAVLTGEPVDPEAELTAWVGAQLTFLRERRSLIRKTMSEIEERPQLLDCVREGPECARRELARYVETLAEHRWVERGADLGTAMAMLMGAIFSDAMGREVIPENYPRPVGAAPRAYARLFLRAVGFRDGARAPATKTEAAPDSRRRTTTRSDTRTR
jgi:AcrR family transcriptional regulator